MESFVSSAIAAGFGANDEQARPPVPPAAFPRVAWGHASRVHPARRDAHGCWAATCTLPRGRSPAPAPAVRDPQVEVEILQKLFQERPIPAHTLLSGSGDATRLVTLAALSDSLDYVAEVIHRCTAVPSSRSGAEERSAGGGDGAGRATAGLPGRRSEQLSSDGSGASTPLAGEASRQGAPFAGAATAQGPSWQQQLGSRLRAWRSGGGEAGALTEGLAHLADRYAALAGRCVRAMRLDLLLLTLHHMQQLPRSSYACASLDEAREVDECVAALARCAHGYRGCLGVWRLVVVMCLCVCECMCVSVCARARTGGGVEGAGGPQAGPAG